MLIYFKLKTFKLEEKISFRWSK